MSTVPFGKLQTAVDAEQRLREQFDLAEDYLRKIFPDCRIGKTMQAVRTTMQSNPELAVGAALASCLPTPVPYDIYVTEKSASVHSLIVGDFRKQPLLKYAMRSLGASAAEGSQAIVLCRLKNMGPCVIHNVPLQSQANPRIVIPASTAGVTQVQVISLDFFVDDINGKRRKENE